MILLDTNIIIALFIAGDNLQAEAKSLLNECDELEIKIIPEVWSETMTVASVRYSSDVAIQIDEQIKELSWGWYEHKTDPNDIWINFWRKKSPHRMSFTDCTLGYLNQHEGFQVLTLDKELQKHLS